MMILIHLCFVVIVVVKSNEVMKGDISCVLLLL